MLHFHKVGTPTSQPSTESQQPVPALVTVARVTVPSAPRYVPPAPAITHPVPPPSAYAPNQAAPQTGLAPAKAAIPLKKQLSLF
jgi:hypothetical protein